MASQSQNSQTSDSTVDDPRLAELLKPIKDLTQNWEVSYHHAHIVSSQFHWFVLLGSLSRDPVRLLGWNVTDDHLLGRGTHQRQLRPGCAGAARDHVRVVQESGLFVEISGADVGTAEEQGERRRQWGGRRELGCQDRTEEAGGPNSWIREISGGSGKKFRH